MLFALPIALLSALYTSQFLDSRFRSIVKPTMEIMASLPSVVLGFLGAIYIAPIIEKEIPSFILLAVGLPLIAAITGFSGVDCLFVIGSSSIQGGSGLFLFLSYSLAHGFSFSWVR